MEVTCRCTPKREAGVLMTSTMRPLSAVVVASLELLLDWGTLEAQRPKRRAGEPSRHMVKPVNTDCNIRFLSLSSDYIISRYFMR